MATSETDKIWLVKSSGRIVGPLTFDEVVNGLRSKEFVILDEVSKPFGRWHYVRDESSFENIVLELKNRENIQPESTFTGTLSFTESHTEIVPNPSEITVTPKSADASENSGTVYGLSPEQKRNNRILVLLLVFICLTTVFFYLKEKGSPGQAGTFADHKKEALYLKAVGNFEKAESEFLTARNKNPNDLELNLAFSNVLISLQDTINAERLLQDQFKLKPSAKEKAQIYNNLGVIYLNHFAKDQAQKNLKMGLELDNKNPALYFNLGVSLLSEKKFAEAETNFLKSIKAGSTEPGVLLLLSQSIFALYDENKDSQKLEDLLEMLSTNTNQIRNFQEIKISEGYVLYKLGKQDEAFKIFDNVLDYDPYESQEHVPNSEYFMEATHWKFILEWLRSMEKDIKPTPRFTALLAYVYFKNKDRREGRELIDQAIRMDPKDSLLISVSSYFSFASGKPEDARVQLAQVQENHQFILPHILNARQCVKDKDDVCAEKEWGTVKKRNANSLGALAGLAQMYLKNGQTLESKKLVEQGLKISATYGPLQAIKKEINETKN